MHIWPMFVIAQLAWSRSSYFVILGSCRTQEHENEKEEVSPDLEELKPLKLKKCFPTLLGS